MRTLLLSSLLIAACTQASLLPPPGAGSDLSSAATDAATARDAAVADTAGCTPVALGAWTWHGGEIPAFSAAGLDAAEPPNTYSIDLIPESVSTSGDSVAYLQAAIDLAPQTPGYWNNVHLSVASIDHQVPHGTLDAVPIYNPAGRCLLIPKSVF